MGEAHDVVPMQLTKNFRRVQSDPNFRSWLEMQDAVMNIEFPVFDLPEVGDRMYAPETLAVAEQKLLELYPDARTAFTGRAVHTTTRYAYYVGETFRRAFEGIWIALPSRANPDGHPAGSAIDFPMREAIVDPVDLVKLALVRRTGAEITRVYGYAERDHRRWVDAGRPERTFVGTLREDDD